MAGARNVFDFDLAGGGEFVYGFVEVVAKLVGDGVAGGFA